MSQIHNLVGVLSELIYLNFCNLVAFQVIMCSYDALHGVAGIYAKKIFVEELSADESSLINRTPKRCHKPDGTSPRLLRIWRRSSRPQFNVCKELVVRLRLGKEAPAEEPPEFGAAADGDADRNMILGRRSLPTSAALGVVAKSLNLKFFEVNVIYHVNSTIALIFI
eukprot:Gb_16679 [translate_table: standard]